jgi:alpha-L-fucosidase
VNIEVFFLSCGGNILVNVGPTKEGRIAPIYEERLRQMGQWLSVNGEAIYETQPWIYQNDTVNSDVWYTSKYDVVYALLLQWPKKSIILGAPYVTPTTEVSMLGYNGTIVWKTISNSIGITIDVSQFGADSLPTQWAWAFKLTNLDF